jgi:hypothetical protein
MQDLDKRKQEILAKLRKMPPDKRLKVLRLEKLRRSLLAPQQKEKE